MYKMLRWKRLTAQAKAPVRGSEQAAGLDLCSDQQYRIAPGARQLISTGIAVEIPAGYYGRIAPRSGLAVKNGIDVGAGVVDSDYRGEVKVLLFNFGSEEFVVNVGDRIAQFIIEPYSSVSVVETKVLETTDRGQGGFGSTGI